MAHTQAPWAIGASEATGIYHIIGGNNIPVAMVGGRPEIKADSHDNAQLIASAPDLLAACEEAYATLLMLDIHFQHTDTIDKLSAAIAKAKGERRKEG